MSKKVVLYIACSLDGFIARKNHDVSWLFLDQDYGFGEFEKSFDTALMGRKSYEFAKQYSDPPFKGKKNLIITSQAGIISNFNKGVDILLIDDAVNMIKEDVNGLALFLVGGTGLITDFFNADMIDELVIAYHPIILGEGIPLFHNINREIILDLKEKEIYDNGLVKLKYEVI